MVAELKQHAATIRKAMVQGKELHASVGGDLLAMNQMVRWINTKEDHCSKIITTVSEYCLCQRVKKEGVFASDAEYVEALKSHHAVLSSAMKAKQTMDTAACDALDKALGRFIRWIDVYFVVISLFCIAQLSRICVLLCIFKCNCGCYV